MDEIMSRPKIGQTRFLISIKQLSVQSMHAAVRCWANGVER